MSDKIHVEIVTPSRKVLSGSCDEVYVPGPHGEIGILPNHASLVSTLATGALRFRSGSETTKVAIRGGFLQVQENQVMVLADEAVLANEVEKTKLTNERNDIEKKLLSADVGVEERETLFSERDWIQSKSAVLEG